MKREGRPHGMVRTYRILPSPLNPRPEPRFIHRTDSPPTAGCFTKVSSKPTNHSKFTGKCGRPRCNDCHVHPACKSKDKAKGTQKQRSCAAVTNYKSISWRVGDGQSGVRFSGASASRFLDHLSTDHTDDYDYDDDDDVDVDDDCVGEVYEEGSCGLVDDGPIWESPPQLLDEDSGIGSSGLDKFKVDDDDDDEEDDADHDKDYNSNNNVDYDVEWMRFTEVGFVLDQVDDWCLVGELE